MIDQFDNTSQDLSDEGDGQLYQFYNQNTWEGAITNAFDAGFEVSNPIPPYQDPDTGTNMPGSFYAYPPEQEQQPQE
jgi:hypothetical protein